ncbi:MULTISPECIES: hypothetical protein [Vibrio diabolicus subgroup]|uniref:hypothetical protein n=1 Tax=Vibrio diabolicus subgroup TaxID=2315253 RepID=UPI00211B71A7|nr:MULTISPECIES: hypothetical protein [Vibrio diabolicus subgroup]MCG9230100.1 hypothetical protein [Vibrio diabolicus]MCG9572830.1 hypothetical protein [Vibrio diabolicus]MCG9592084.1 hypothetical protein [Vibrio diabolicus]MCG9619452.1 hypothetical protein [Vibrio diabolicus]MCG9776581.1 hypothetical protein [Vibrio diabolicus]
MLGLLDTKTLKNATIALYHELVRGRIYEGKHFGLNADDISKKTGLNTHSATALIHRLIDNELVEKYGFKNDVSYRAANIPIHLEQASAPIQIFQYVNRVIGRVDFKGIV